MTDEYKKIKNPDGSWKYTNSLENSLSPYLQQHAHNPVNWYEWNNATLEKAKQLEKPIFVSIGYSTCYWCHVMEREIFINEEIAKILNENFINIKVDKEDRPDLDDIFMTTRQIMTRDAGWPNNLFLTPPPDLKPFFAGGTFGPDNRYGQISFNEILTMVNESWSQKKEHIYAAAAEISRAIIMNYSTKAENLPASISTHDIIESLFAQLKSYADPRSGGFFQSPKFPHEVYIQFLNDFYKVTDSPEALEMIESSLDNMAAGGICDQVGGGFHRYATDRNWIIPHFEKMLYNQAQISKTYAFAYEVLKKDQYKRVAVDILGFVTREMTSKDGAFYSAIDAETHSTEGEYYVWTRDEIFKILNEKEFELFSSDYSLAPVPAQEGHNQPEGNILHCRNIINEFSEENRKKLSPAFAKLLSERDKRQKPFIDDKIITAWNGMMIDAFAFCGRVFAEEKYVKIAEKAADFVTKKLIDKDGNLLRSVRSNKKSDISAFMEDYAYLISGVLSLYDATSKKKWLNLIEKLVAKADEIFWDESKGGYYFTQQDQSLIIRMKTGSDAAFPSDNSVMLNNFIRLKQIKHDRKYDSRISQITHNFYRDIVVSPINHANLIYGLLKNSDYKPKDMNNIGGTVSIIANDNKYSSATHVACELLLESDKQKIGKEFSAELKISINKGWHINSNPASLQFLIPTQAIFKGKGIIVKNITYPETTKTIAMDDAIANVYEGEISIIAQLELDKSLKGEKSTDLSVILTLQACNSDKCLAPSNVNLDKAIEVG